MTVRSAFWRKASLGLLVAAELAACTAVTSIAVSVPASAQFFGFDERYPFLDPRPRRRGGYMDPYSDNDRPPDFSRAPAPIPRKPDAPPMTTKILVLGDSMADWLAHGLDDALSETPEIGVVRKHKAFSGLIKYDAKPDAPEWSQVARELIAAEKPQAVIMMIGVQDRQAIREKIVVKPVEAKPAEQKPAEQKPGDQKPAAQKPGEQKPGDQKPAAQKPGEQKADAAKQTQKPQEKPQEPADDEQQPNVAAPEPQRSVRAGGLHEYHTEKWEELYSKRIDETIAALKSANIPVLWVGLPSIRGQKSTADALYLNEFYRARAEAAGILYVDVWDGFVDEQGRYSNRGPDFEGQMRVLRAGDGVHFTKFGARKLAHYVERELRRVLSATPVALTTPEPAQPAVAPAQPAKPAAPAQRPLAGPVFMLTTNVDETDELLGGGAARQPAIDPVATSVLVKGEAIASAAGRADDYSWPPRVPNLKFDEPLPPSGSPVFMARPAPAQPPRPASQTAQGGQPGQARVAGQQVLQGQVAPQQGGPRSQPGQQWRAPPPAYYGPPRGFFGLFR
jgi:hypothetical protein